MSTPGYPSIPQSLAAWMQAAEKSGEIVTKAKSLLVNDEDRIVLVNSSLVKNPVYYVTIRADMMELSPDIQKARKFSKSEIVEFLFANALLFGVSPWDCQLVPSE